MDIRIKPCDGMSEAEAIERALSIFKGNRVDYQSRPIGIEEGTVLTYADDAEAYFYRTKNDYVVRFNRIGGHK